MSVVNITSENFESEVLNSQGTVLVDFYADWCGPCKMIAPLVHEVADEHPEIKVFKINVDDEMNLAKKYRVMSIPTLLVFKGGELVKRHVGELSKDEILQMVL